MDNELSTSHRKKDGRGLRQRFFGHKASQDDQTEGDGHSSSSRSYSRLLRSRMSPGLKVKEAENPLSATGTNSANSNVALDDSTTIQLVIRTDSIITAVGPNIDNDMWKIAEEELRQDPKKCGILEEYDRILEAHFGSKLEPVGSLERRQQFLGFLNSELKKINAADSAARLRKCSNKSKRFFKSAVACIVASKDIIAPATSACLPASVACTGVVVLLSFCLQAVDQRHVFFDGLNAISSSVRRIAEYENLLYQNNIYQTEEAQISITAACRNIIEFQARAACSLQRNLLESTIRNMFKWDGWNDLLLAIREAEARVKDNAERKSMNDICKIFEKLDESENNIRERIGEGFSRLAETQEAIDRKQKVDEFLQLLYNNASSYEDSKSRNRERITGTCDWFTDHDLFKQWNLPMQNRCESSSLLYVTADPGCGKSVLSRYLIEQILPDDQRTVCYFFFKDDFDDQKSSLAALCTLLHQLFVLNRHLLTDTILEKYGAHGNKLVESFAELWKVFIAAASHQETVCVLDALDECRDADRKQLIDVITGPQVGSLKFLLTSRPYEHIRREVSYRINGEMSLIHLQGDCGDTADAIVQEIQLVVESRINETAKSFRLLSEEHDLMRKQLNSVPNRTYLWITLVFDGLMENKSGITKKDIIALTKKLPRRIEEAYEKILAKSDDQEKAKKLLYLILGAKRPLSLLEVSIALAFNGEKSWNNVEEDIIPEKRIQDSIRSLCGLFVTVVDKKVYLLHQTAKEFLVPNPSDQITRGHRLDGPRNYDEALPSLTRSWQHSMDLTHSNSILAEICISYLHSDFFKKNDLFLEYSAIYWPDHYHQSEKDYQEVMEEMTRDICLLSPSRAQWTKIHSRYSFIPLSGSSLCLAAALGLDRAVERILHMQNSSELESDNEVNSKDDERSHTPLSWAAQNGREAVVRLLLNTGKAEINSQDEHGSTPLALAVGSEFEAVVRLLLDTGRADINLKDYNNLTPFSYAIATENEAIIRLLTDNGADTSIIDEDGMIELSKWSE